LSLQLAGATTSIADGEAALRDAEQRHEIALSTAASELAEQRAESARALSQIVAERDGLSHTLRDTEAARDALSAQLAEATRSIEEANERANRELAAAAERERDLAARLARETESRNTVEQTLADERAAAAEAERCFRAEADALRAHGLEQQAQFEVLLAQEQLERESRLAEMRECARKLGLERDALQQSFTAAQESSRQVQETLAATARRLEEASHRAEALQAEADQLPQLREQAEEIRAENNRLFEQAGLAMFRCTPYGSLIHANRACATLAGRRALEQPPEHFAAAVFEAPDALSWLIERCLSTRTKESIETTWRRNDGGRLHVRLLARLLPSDAIEVVVEDLTRLRVLEERLDQAHRMEAVGRFASEVAVTCSNLLSDIHQNAEQWLTAAADHVDRRKQGALLIEEVKRAADLLHQLAAFGDEQARTPMLVDLNTLIRDLEPVLKRLAGNQIDVEIRDSSSPLTVDVQAERVERLLVNLTSYGRDRMPSGGRLRIDLAMEVVDRHFAAKHHNVRLGLHALITVTGIRAAVRDGALHLRDESQRSNGRSATRPGADFGTLQRLVSECGGHLWMKVQPAGDVIAKVRLPLQNGHDQALSKALVARGGRERAATRWFQS
jgi:nitrogen-specific signal transduction histidine kinase